MNIIFSVLCSTSFIEYLVVECAIFHQHDKYLRMQGIKCGVVPPRTKTSAGRIINGRPTAAGAVYPWMVHIKMKVIGSEGLWYTSGGSIITHKVVLTCGHCICHDEYMDCTDGGNTEPNLNKAGQQEIHVTQVGDPTAGDALPDLQFNPRIKAYIYRYAQPDPATYPHGFSGSLTFSKNGDIGIVINHNSFVLTRPNVAPICLPAEDNDPTTDTLKGKKVRTAAWGDRYEELAGKDGRSGQTSCQTNQGKTMEMQFPKGIQTAFFPCVNQELDGKHFCAQIPTAIHTFSNQAMVTFRNKQMEISPLPASSNKCEKYWNEAKKAFYRSWPGKSVFGDFDQLVIQEECGFGAVVDVCYNIKKVGKYGICQVTFGSSKKPNWGFCSRSCAMSDIWDGLLRPGEQYEEAEFLYYDVPPPGSILAEGMKWTHNKSILFK